MADIPLIAGQRVTIPSGEYVPNVSGTLTPFVPPPQPPVEQPLALTALSPASLPTGSKLAPISVLGTGFTPSSLIFWNGALPASGTAFVSDARLDMKTASGGLTTVGPRQVQVKDGIKQSNVLAFQVTAVQPPPPANTFLGGYRYVEALLADLGALVTANPAPRIRVRTYGQSYAKQVGGVTFPNGSTCPGFPLTGYQVGDLGKPALCTVWNLHANEIVNAEIGFLWLQWLATSTEADAVWLRANRCNVVYPCVNPDGLWAVGLGARLGGAPLPWRKNLHFPAGAQWSLADVRLVGERYPGTNLNRNFSYGWGQPGHYASTDEYNRNYIGASAEIEPECSLLMQDISGVIDETLDPDHSELLALSYHSSDTDTYVSFPWGASIDPHPEQGAYIALAQSLASIVGYKIGQISTSVISDKTSTRPGCFEDSVDSRTNGAALLIETVGTTLMPPFSQVAVEWARHKPLLIEAAKRASSPLGR